MIIGPLSCSEAGWYFIVSVGSQLLAVLGSAMSNSDAPLHSYFLRRLSMYGTAIRILRNKPLTKSSRCDSKDLIDEAFMLCGTHVYRQLDITIRSKSSLHCLIYFVSQIHFPVALQNTTPILAQ